MRLGRIVTPATPWPFPASQSLYSIALEWLKEDKEYRRGLENMEKAKIRGPRDEVHSPFHLFVISNYSLSDRPLRL
jgi:CCR4-NOT complex subunit CAF16